MDLQAGFTESESRFGFVIPMNFFTEYETRFSVNPNSVIEYALTQSWLAYIYRRQSSVSHQCRGGSSHPLETSTRPYHSTGRAASLVACPSEDWIQAVCTSVMLPYTAWLQNIWPTASNPCLTSRHGDIFVRQQHHNWSSYRPPAVQHSGDRASERSLSPLHAPEKLFSTQCHLLRHFYL